MEVTLRSVGGSGGTAERWVSGSSSIYRNWEAGELLGTRGLRQNGLGK